VVKVTITNGSTSTTAIQSANINLPPQLNLVSGSGLPSDNVTTATQQVQVRGVKIQPGKTFVATFQVNTACGGTFTWPVQQAYSEDNAGGTSFGPPSSSTGLTTSLNTGCYLGFVAQPTDTEIGGKIADAGASQGGPITVGLFTSAGARMSACPVGFTSSCNAIVGETGTNNPPDGILANGADSLTQPLTGSPLIATFSHLAITGAATPEQFRLTATGDGSFAPTMNS
jgi:hypothetical protein